jgi:thioesterase domain-containing protein
MRAYRLSEYSGKVVFFKGENSVLPYGFHESSEIEWKRLVGQGLEIEQLSCDHATIMKGPYVAQIAHKIRAAMDRAINRDRQTKEKVRARAGHSADAALSE